MAKNISYCIFLLLLCVCCNSRVSYDTVTVTPPSILNGSDDSDNQVEDDNNPNVVTTLPSNAEPVVEDATKKLTDIYLSQLGVREATGKNDGKEVEKYLRSTGFGPGNAWCAAFVHYCLEEAKIPNTVNAWSPTAENKKHIIFRARQQLEEPEPGDVVCFFYTNLNRIGHTGFFHRRISDVTYESVEGNTNIAGSREGDGVYKKFRSFNSTFSISRWKRKQ